MTYDNDRELSYFYVRQSKADLLRDEHSLHVSFPCLSLLFACFLLELLPTRQLLALYVVFERNEEMGAKR